MNLSNYVDLLESKGQFWFNKADALQELGCTEGAFNSAIKRLGKKSRIASIRAGFMVILPLSYRNSKVVPGSWFIEQLMQYLKEPYYVGLLSAADMYGAAHQKPQIYQVVTRKKLKPITEGKLGLEFYGNENIEKIPTNSILQHSGYIKVATPEAVALDVVKYYRSCGYLSNVATVLLELHENMELEKFLSLIKSNIYEWPILQRVGYLLSLPEVEGAHMVEELKALINENKPRFVPLQPGQPISKRQKDPVWRVYVNEEIEVDL